LFLDRIEAAEYGLGDYSAAGLHFAEALQMAVENGGSLAGNRIALCYALDGLRAGDRVRIAVQLIHAINDQHIWAESYERDFRDILSLQRYRAAGR
jgi:hypothetical protein